MGVDVCAAVGIVSFFSFCVLLQCTATLPLVEVVRLAYNKIVECCFCVVDAIVISNAAEGEVFSGV